MKLICCLMLCCSFPGGSFLQAAFANADNIAPENNQNVHVFLNQTESENSMPQPVRAEIRLQHGKPTLWINDQPQFAFAYLPHAGDFARQYSQMRDVGIRFYSLYAGIGNTAEGFDPTNCDEPYHRLLRHHPDAYIFPRIDIGPPSWWLDQHPEERVVYDDGSLGPQSMFSETWLNAAIQWMEDYSRYIRTGPYADRVMGVHICTGHTGEWQSWGLWDNLRGDFSIPALKAWREYLAAKYGTDTEWRSAWGEQAQTSLENAEIPTRARREQSDGTLLRNPQVYQDVIDFYDFYWRGTVNAIEKLARAAKRGGGEDWLVGIFYGYQIQYGGLAQESQHLGMKYLMDCPDIDFFCSPAMYSRREPGGTSTFMSFTESIQNRGKLWWDEADNRTHLVTDPMFAPVAPAENLWESLNVLQREFAHNMVRQTALWWFDMSGGWYDDPAILNMFQQMRELGESHVASWRPEVEVAVFLDDKSLYRIPPAHPYLNHIPPFLADLPRLGAPYHTYLLADLEEAPEYTAYIFINAFDLTDEERQSIENLKRDGKTLLFVGPAGSGRWHNGRVEHTPESSETLVAVPQQGTGIQSQVFEGWRAAWVATPEILMQELRELFRETGEGIAPVHLYHQEDDALYIGNGYMALHAQHAGDKIIQFKNSVRLQELFTETPVNMEGDSFTLSLEAKETRSFIVKPVQ